MKLKYEIRSMKLHGQFGRDTVKNQGDHDTGSEMEI